MTKYRYGRGLICLCAWALFQTGLNADQIVYVNQGAPAGSAQTGASWANAYRELRDAIAASNPTATNKVEIWVARGTYKPTAGTDRSASFKLRSHLRILGGFAGTEVDPDTRNIASNPTVLSGDIGLPLPASNRIESASSTSYRVSFAPEQPAFQDNSYNVLTATGVVDVVLEGLIVANGNANYRNDALLSIDSNLTATAIDSMRMPFLSDAETVPGRGRGDTLVRLDRRVAGGGLFVMNEYERGRTNDYHLGSTNVSVILNLCVFLNNAAEGYGGGVSVREAYLMVNACQFINNHAGVEGGAYWGMNQEGHFLDSTFERNTAASAGGGVVLQSIGTEKLFGYLGGSSNTAAGLSDKDVIKSINQFANIQKSAWDLANDQTFVHKFIEFYNWAAAPSPASNLPRVDRMINAIKSMPASARDFFRSLNAGSIARGAAGAYAALQVIISVGDLVTAGMDDTNNADLRRWREFSNGFNTYATPGGWSMLLANALTKALGGPDPRFETLGLKQVWLSLYNPSHQIGHPSYNSIRYCTFRENYAGVAGGGLSVSLDNVHIEGAMFDRNRSEFEGAGASFGGWSTPVILSTVFQGNQSVAGYSAIANAYHSRAQIVNCTIVNNGSGITNGFAVGNELGSEVKIMNSIFWGNTNASATFAQGGADIFTTMKSSLSGDALELYDEAGIGYPEWVGLCEVRNSIVQGLNQMEEGRDDIPLFTESRTYSSREIEQVKANKANAEKFAALEGSGFVNLGEGNRPGLKTSLGNSTNNPLLVNGYIPSPISPAIDHGDGRLLNNGLNGINSITGADIQKNSRFRGASLDIGAVEFQSVPGAAVIYVKHDAAGPEDGRSWATAYRSIERAMIHASPGVELWVAAGTYYSAADPAPEKYLSLLSGISLYGGFSGTETNRNQRNWRANRTIISGEIGSALTRDDNTYSLFVNYANSPAGTCDASAVLDGFILTAARDSAIINYSANPTIRNCVFESNSGNHGAAIRLMHGANSLIESCILRSNSAYYGAAVSAIRSRPIIRNSLLHDNRAVDLGGAIYADDQSLLQLINSTVAENIGGRGAGGILSCASSSYVYNSIVWHNRSGEAGDSAAEAQLIITNGLVLSNSTIQGMAGYDPLFVNRAGKDFRLQSLSPALDAGGNALAAGLSEDIAGNVRISGGAVDLGAYESASVAPATPVRLSEQPTAREICSTEASILFAVDGFEPGSAYAWQFNGGSGFASVAGLTNASVSVAGTRSTLALSFPGVALNNAQFRFVLPGVYTSTPVTLAVSAPRVIYVDAASPYATKDGTSWLSAYTNLTEALADANACSEIWVADGTYRPLAGNNPWILKRGVGLYGGFSGSELVRSQRNPAANPTILQNNGDSILESTNPDAGIGGETVIDGFILRSTGPRISVSLQYASPTIRGCTFDRSDSYAVLLQDAAGVITNCRFSANAGAVWLRNAGTVISGSEFINNTNSSGAAGIVIQGGQPVIELSHFEGNVGASGGAIEIGDDSRATVRRCILRNNRAANGGAIYSASSEAQIENCLITGNRAFRGGAIAQSQVGADSNDVEVIHCTIAFNQADAAGGGYFGYGGHLVSVNSIWWGNDDNEAYTTLRRQQYDGFTNASFAVSYSAVEGLTNPASGNIAYDPLFESNFTLNAWSPAVNAGLAAASAGVTEDLAGQGRLFGPAPDLGAYEFQSAAQVPLLLSGSPQNRTWYEGAPAMFTVSKAFTNQAVRWYVDQGSGFALITNDTVFAVVEDPQHSVLTIASAALAMGGWKIRYEVDPSGFTSSALALAVMPSPVLFVRANAPVGGDGASWASAFQNIQQALGAIGNGGEIWVARGIYPPATNLFGQSYLSMKPNVGIYGGFAGSETSRIQRSWSSNHTVLTSSQGAVIYNPRGVSLDQTAILDGFVFSNVTGFAAIENHAGSQPMIRNCRFVQNRARGIYNEDSAPVIEACVFADNPAGAIYNRRAAPQIRSSVFMRNGSENNYGAIFNLEYTAAVIEDSVFDDNNAQSGGAISSIEGSVARIQRSTFANNTSGNGGAIHATSATNIIRNSLFYLNMSTFRGGAIAQYGGCVELINSTLSDNGAEISGGGLYLQQASGVVANSVLWDNFVSRSSPPQNPDIQQLDMYEASVRMTNSTLQGLAVAGNNNQQFAPLFVDPAAGNYRPSGFSPLRDAGEDSLAALPALDLDGQNRKSGVRVDQGAYESYGAPSNVLRFTTLPDSVSRCAMQDACFTVAMPAGEMKPITWQKLEGTNYVNLATGGGYAIADSSTSSTLCVAGLAPGRVTYRFAITNTGYASPPFTLDVLPRRVIYVKSDAPFHGNGLSWTSAYRSIQVAASSADGCADIWVAAGDYRSTNEVGSIGSLMLPNGTTIYGGFVGTETNLAQRSWTSHVTRIVADNSQSAIFNYSTYARADRSAVLDGFTIVGEPDEPAVYLISVSPTFRNCRFISGDPAMWLTAGAEPLVENCVFESNPGGAIFGYRSSPVVTNAVFAHNGPGMRMGGIYIGEGSPIIMDSVFRANSSQSGGGLYFEQVSNAVIERCQFVDNAASEGAGILVSRSGVRVVNSLFTGNRASYRGGGIMSYGDGAQIVNCTVVDNEATRDGGGVYHGGGSLSVINSILWGNRGGELYASREASQLYRASGTAALSYSTIEAFDTLVGPGNNGDDPLFVDLPGGNYQLQPVFSPAIDAGTNTALMGALDLAGHPRVVNAPAAGGVDRGAYEAQLPGMLKPVRLASAPSRLSGCLAGLCYFGITGPPGTATNIAWEIDTGSGFVPLVDDAAHTLIPDDFNSDVHIYPLDASMNGWLYRYIYQSAGYTSAPLPLAVDAREIIYVDSSATGSPQGTSWANAYTSLAPAIARADACSEIWIAEGTYRHPALTLKEGIQIFGGFSGAETHRSQRNVSLHTALLKTDSSVIFYGDHVSRATVIDGLTLGGDPGVIGVQNYNGGPAFLNCRFRDFSVYAVYNLAGAQPYFNQCTFEQNTGTPIRNLNAASVDFVNCVFQSNDVPLAGGISSDDSSIRVQGGSFRDNYARSGAGAIQNAGGTTVVDRVLFLRNRVEPTSDGGAILNYPGSRVIAVSSVFDGNAARRGGAIANWGTLTSINNTFYRNQSDEAGSGVYQGAGDASLINSILWNNAPTIASIQSNNIQLAQIHVDAGAVTVSHSVVEGPAAYPGIGNLILDPLFVDPDAGDYALAGISPAADAGDDAALADIPEDFAGTARLQGSHVDIGAVEGAATGAALALLATPLSQSLCAGSSASLTVVWTNPAISAPQWAYDAGFGWNTLTYDVGSGSWTGPVGAVFGVIAGADRSTLQISGADSGLNGVRFRAAFSGIFSTAPATIRVSPTQVIYVNQNALPGGDGTSWLTAYQRLGDALASISDCRRIIWVAAGTYKPTTGSDRTLSFEVPAGAGLFGGFAGTETSITQRNVSANRTLLSGNIGSPTATNDNSDFVVEFDGRYSVIDQDTVLDGFTIEGGSLGGIYLNHASPLIARCAMRAHQGPAVYARDSAARIEQCGIYSNSASQGAGVYVRQDAADTGELVVYRTEFFGNVALYGGGVDVEKGQARIVSSLFRQNSSSGAGGAIHVGTAATGRVVNCTIYGNESLRGGGVSAAGQVAIDNTILWQNNSSVPGDSRQDAQVYYEFGSVAASHACVEGYTNLPGAVNSGVDPLFVDPVNEDFRLQACSALIDAGASSTVTGFASDLAGNARTMGSAVDVGALEFTGSASTPLYIVTPPLSQTACAADPVSFSVQVAGTNLVYQWQVSTGGAYSNVSGSATSSVLALSSTAGFGSSSQFRCVISSPGGCIVVSEPATLTIPASRIYVDASAAPGGDGLSWGTALRSLDGALTSSLLSACAEIWVADGIYQPQGATFNIPDGLKLYGGFAGDEASRAARNLALHPSILNGTNMSAVVALSAVGGSTTLDGFTVRGGSRGIQLFHADATLRNLTVTKNLGAGISVQGGSPLIEQSVIASNASTFGGGLWVFDGAPVLRSMRIFGNQASTAGGGLFAQGGLVTVENSLIFGNASPQGGGGIGLAGTSSARIVHATIAGNDSDQDAGGISAGAGSSLTMMNCIVWGNTSDTETGNDQQVICSMPTNISYTLIQGLGEVHTYIPALDMTVISTNPAYLGRGNLNGNPLFLDADQQDFRIAACSPAVDAGTNQMSPSLVLDLAGQSRPYGASVVDLGAYEVQATAEGILSIVSQPVSVSFCGSASFNVAANGTGLTHQWQRKTGASFVDLFESSAFSGTASSNLTIVSASSADNGAVFRCRITSSSGCVIYSDPVVLSVASGSGRWYVDASASGNNTGSSWQNAFPTIENALSGAAFQPCNNEIWVAAGTYVLNSAIAMKNNVALLGGFTGTETNANQRNWVANETIISGDGGTPGVRSDNLDYLINNDAIALGYAVGRSARLDGFVLTGARVQAIRNFQGPSPTIAHCVFRNNEQGMWNVWSYPLVESSVFENNGSTNVDGAGIYVQSGAIEVRNSIFRNNTADFGAGMFSEFGTATVYNCLFSGNDARDAAGLCILGGLGTVRNSTFSGNRGTRSGAALSGNLTAYNCIIWSNLGSSATYYPAPLEYEEKSQVNLGGGGLFHSIIQNISNYAGHGNSGSDPLFLSPVSPALAPTAAGNYRFSYCSPAMDFGLVAQAPAGLDLDGNARVQGRGVDLGAYEAAAPALALPTLINVAASILQTAVLSVANSATGVVYAWEYSTNGTDFISLADDATYSGTATSTLEIRNPSPSMHGTAYRSLATYRCYTFTSAVAQFTYVNAAPIALPVTTNRPEDAFDPLTTYQSFLNGFYSDPEGDPVTLVFETQPAVGSIVYDPDWLEYDYVAARNYNGPDSFTYKVTDGMATSAPALVSLTITPVNDQPTVSNQTVYVVEDTPLVFQLNAHDPDGDVLAVNLYNPAYYAPTNGAVSFSNITATYTPNPNAYGQDRFRYSVHDGQYPGDQVGRVTVVIQPVNDLPVAAADNAKLYRGQSVLIPILANDSDVESSITLTSMSQPSHGTVSVVGTNVLYTHDGSATTNDAFVYQIEDTDGAVAYGSVSIAIQSAYAYRVTTAGDDGEGSLRQAVRDAATVSSNLFTIRFSPALAGQTIQLSTVGDQAFGPSALALSNRVAIDGSDAPLLTIARDATGAVMRLLRIAAGSMVEIRNVALAGGVAAGEAGFDGVGGGGGGGGFGGAILNEGGLSMQSVTFRNNTAEGGTGGIQSGGFPDGGNGGGPNGGIAPFGNGGFGGGGAGGGSSDFGQGGLAGYGGGKGGGHTSGPAGGAGGFGGGGGGGPGSSFTGGGGLGAGGAIFNHGGTLAITNAVFTGNAASGGPTGAGSAPHYEGTDGTGEGAAIFNYNGVLQLASVDFVSNTAVRGQSILNLGDDAVARADLSRVTVDTAETTNAVLQVALGTGRATLHRDYSSSLRSAPLSLDPVADVNALGVSQTTIRYETRSNLAVEVAASAPTSAVESIAVSGVGTSRVVEVTPAFGRVAPVPVLITLTQGPYSVSQSFLVQPVRVSTVSVISARSLLLPVIPTNQAWSISNLGQGFRGFTFMEGGAIRYQNAAGGPSDTFYYTLTRGGTTVTGTVMVVILPNQIPQAYSQVVYALAGYDVPVHLQGTDGNGDPLTFILQTYPAGGLLGAAPDLLYAAADQFSGEDNFTYTVSDGYDTSAPALIRVIAKTTQTGLVASATDSGAGSLRALIQQANQDPSAFFVILPDPSGVNTQAVVTTIGDSHAWGASAYVISNSMSISGIAIVRDSYAPEMRLFRVASNALLRLSEVTLQGGLIRGESGEDGNGSGGGGMGAGGAVFNEGMLETDHVIFRSNIVVGGSAGVYVPGGSPGAGGGAEGGVAGSGAGGFASGGGGAVGSNSFMTGLGGLAGYGGGDGAQRPMTTYDTVGGAGGFGGGGGGGAYRAGGGGMGAGAGVFNNAGVVTLQNTLFTNNTAEGGVGGYPGFNDGQGLGSSVFSRNGSVEISSSTFGGNSRSTDGGDVHIVGDQTTGVLHLAGASFPFGTMSVKLGTNDAAGGRVEVFVDKNQPYFDMQPVRLGSFQARLLNPESGPYTNAVSWRPALASPDSRSLSFISGNESLIPSSNVTVQARGNYSVQLAIQPLPEIYGRATVMTVFQDGPYRIHRPFDYSVGVFGNIVPSPDGTGTLIRVDMPYWPDVTVRVERASTLFPANWIYIGDAVPGLQGPEFHDPDRAGNRYFYRFTAQP